MPNNYSDSNNSTVNENGSTYSSLNSTYTGNSMNGAGCTYSSLPRTYSGQYANGLTSAQGSYVVPALCPNGPPELSYPPSYNTLQHGGQHTCNGYFHMSGAYPAANCSSCKATYVERPCKGNISAVCNPVAVEGFRQARFFRR